MRAPAGFNVIVWGPEKKPLVLDLVEGEVPRDMDFDNFKLHGLELVQPADSKTAELSYSSEKITLEFRFTGIHEPFSYRQNPDGLPEWFALNRFEQSGWVKGFLKFGDRQMKLDRIGHRDHSWGMRKWGVPHHWKWLVAYTPDASQNCECLDLAGERRMGRRRLCRTDGELIPISHVKQHATFDKDMSQRSINVDITDIRGNHCDLEMERFGIVKLPTGGRFATMIMEAACFAKIDGIAAAGQYETQWSQDYLDRAIELNKSDELGLDR